MNANRAIVSPNVGEELRVYAHEREEEMRKRVAEFRQRKEEEYRRFADESSREIEMIEFLAHNNPSKIDEIFRSIDDLIDRFRSRTNEAEDASTGGAIIADLIRETEESRRENFSRVREIVDEKISEFLFGKKNQIVGKYDKLRTVADEMRRDDFSWIHEIADRNRWEKILSEIDAANGEVARAVRSQGNEKIRLEQQIEDACELEFREKSTKVQTEIAERVGRLKSDFDADIRFRAKKIDSIRRRTLIAVEKRIWDIQQGAMERKQAAVSEAVSEYKAELMKLFSRFLEELSRNALEVEELVGSSKIDFETIWNRRTPASLAYRVKFIQVFLERFGADPTLAQQLHNVLTQH